MTTPNALSRRTVLRGLGTAIALPLLDVMSSTRLLSAASAPETSPLRMAFFYVPNGMHMPDWTPSKEGSNFDLPPTLAKIAEHQDSFNVLTGLALDGAMLMAMGVATTPAALPRS